MTRILYSIMLITLLSISAKAQTADDKEAVKYPVVNASATKDISVQYLRATDNVVVIDSVVVDKDSFLQAYLISDEIGTLSLSNDHSKSIYTTERNDRIYTAVYTDIDSLKVLQLAYQYKEGDNLSQPYMLEGIGIADDCNYPFITTDGQTLYFAARSNNGLGNYDLYATRYNEDEKRWFRAENMGCPYNSPANDYMLVIDEGHNIGWFASDRFQTEGKVCVYTFIPNNARHPYDYENTDKALMRKYAQLLPISANWNADNESIREEAKNVLMQMNIRQVHKPTESINFVVNDIRVLHSIDEMPSDEAKDMCREWIQKSKNIASLQEELSALRSTYHDNTTAGRAELKDKIINMESRIRQLKQEAHALEKRLRKTVQSQLL